MQAPYYLSQVNLLEPTNTWYIGKEHTKPKNTANKQLYQHAKKTAPKTTPPRHTDAGRLRQKNCE